MNVSNSAGEKKVKGNPVYAGFLPSAGDAAVYMQPKDVENMAEVLYQTLADSQLLEELQARGVKRAAEFSWQREAELTQQLYRQVATEDKGVGSDVDAKISTLLGRSEST